MIGRRFRRLLVLSHVGWITRNDGRRISTWLCRCDCGNEVVVRRNYLISGNKKSCGCLHRERAKKLNFKHGLYRHPLYKIWRSMKQRCLNPSTVKDKISYYDKGITIPSDWHEFEPFYEWAKDKWEQGLILDRIDNTKGYSPENCQFTTLKKSLQNQQKSRIWYMFGKRFNSCSDAAKFWGYATGTIRQLCLGRVSYGIHYGPEAHCYSVKRYA